MAVGDITAALDGEVPCLVADRANPAGEPSRQILLEGRLFEWRFEEKAYSIIGEPGSHPLNVLVTHRARPRVDQRANLGFVVCASAFAGHLGRDRELVCGRFICRITLAT